MTRYLFLGIFLLASLFLSACSNGKQAGLDKNFDTRPELRGMRPDFGQPEEEPSIRGLVKSIIGNEVTILKIDQPQFNRGDEVEGTQAEEAVEEKKTVLGATTGVPGARGAGMGRPGMGGVRPEMSDDQQAQMFERIKAMSSGEVTVTIPVGIQMLKPNMEADKMEMLEASLADVTANKMIQIWLDDSIPDRQIAKFVLIMK